MNSIFVTGVACLLGFGAAPEPTTLQEPVFHGSWRVLAYTYRGDKSPPSPADLKDYRVVFGGDNVEIFQGSKPPERIGLRVLARHEVLTFEFQKDPTDPAKFSGACVAKGDKLYIAFVDGNEPCPREFPKDPAIFILLERIK